MFHVTQNIEFHNYFQNFEKNFSFSFSLLNKLSGICPTKTSHNVNEATYLYAFGDIKVKLIYKHKFQNPSREF